ncbi:MAG: L,D-transpeptidase [Bacillota bacterium]
MRKIRISGFAAILAVLLLLPVQTAFADPLSPLLPDVPPVPPISSPAAVPPTAIRPLLESTGTIETSAVQFSAYAPTINMTFAELIGDDGYYKLPTGFAGSDTYRIIVDIYHQVVMVYTKDTNGEYTVPVRYMLCSTGLNGATPIGDFKMDNYRVRFGRFANDGRCGQYWTQIQKRIYFHTTLYSQKSASTYLVDTYNKLGRPDSHGCVRLTVPDARWIYYNIAPDTQIEIRKGSASDVKTAEIRLQLLLAKAPEKRITLVKGDIPNTDNWSIEDVPHEVKYVQGSQND